MMSVLRTTLFVVHSWKLHKHTPASESVSKLCNCHTIKLVLSNTHGTNYGYRHVTKLRNIILNKRCQTQKKIDWMVSSYES